MKNEIKKKFIGSRVDDDDHARIHAAAFSSGNMDVSDYIRRCALLGIIFKIEAKVPDEIQMVVESMSLEDPEAKNPPQKQRKNASG